MNRRSKYWIVAACFAALIAVPIALAVTFSNSTTITINDSPAPGVVGTASPYPSPVTVSGVTGTVTKVKAAVFQLSHQLTDDIDMVLVGPTGAKVMLMSDAGGDAPATNVNITFDDAAAASVPDNTPLVSGTFKPADYPGQDQCPTEPNPDTFPPPGPGNGPFPTTLSTFNSLDPNGTWNLYVVDDCNVDTGSIAQGWAVDITTTTTAVGVTRFSAEVRKRAVALHWRTGSETRILGFNVYRSTAGGGSRDLNRTLIAARRSGTAGGAAYSLGDRNIRRATSYTYRLQVVGLDGRRQWAGSTAVRTAS